MKIIIPMAGLGTRFAKVAHLNPEYFKPKPFIMVKKRPMVRWATGSLPFVAHADQKKNKKHRVFPQDLIFIILKEHNEAHHLEEQLRQLYSPQINVIVLDAVTRGAAETAYKAKDLVNDNEELLITDSDHYFDGRYLDKVIINRHPKTAGIIPVFSAPKDGPAKWSYSLIGEKDNVIIKVAEKDPILRDAGAYANIGAYYFSKAKHFFKEAYDVITKDRRFGDPGKAEFYIAPLYQNLIEKGYRVEAAVMPKGKVWGLGTPEDLEHFFMHCEAENP